MAFGSSFLRRQPHRPTPSGLVYQTMLVYGLTVQPGSCTERITDMPAPQSEADEYDPSWVLPIVGANIIARRNHFGMSQRTLAELASVNRHHLRDVESGQAAPTVILLAKVAKALDSSVYALTAGT